MRHRADTIQDETVNLLRQIGASVTVTSQVAAGFPDLVVGFRGRTMLLELKTGNEKLSVAEEKWHAKWSGHVAIVRTPEQAQIAVVEGAR